MPFYIKVFPVEDHWGSQATVRDIQPEDVGPLARVKIGYSQLEWRLDSST